MSLNHSSRHVTSIVSTSLTTTEAVFHEAVSHRSALDIALAQRPSLALIDIALSGSPRSDFIKSLREAAPTTPILVLSSHDDRLYAERALRAGARGYVMKRSWRSALAWRLARCCAGGYGCRRSCGRSWRTGSPQAETTRSWATTDR